MKKSINHIQSKIGVFDKNSILTPISYCLDMGMLGEIKGSRYHSMETYTKGLS